jgi:hypothetical protein
VKDTTRAALLHCPLMKGCGTGAKKERCRNEEKKERFLSRSGGRGMRVATAMNNANHSRVADARVIRGMSCSASAISWPTRLLMTSSLPARPVP